MDYDDLVDQFIVNDPNDRSDEDEATETEIDLKDSGVKENSINSAPSEQDRLNLSIHLKSLIQARHLSRQTRKLENIKERNKKLELKAQEIGTIGTIGIIGTVRKGFLGNNERRRRLLKATTPSLLTNNERLEQEEDDSDVVVDEVEESETNEEDEKDTTCTTTPNPSELIPCRLELDHEGYKLSDVFLLPSLPAPTQSEIETISSQLCQEYDLPVDLFFGPIAKCLKDQVEEWHVYQGALDGMKVPYDEIGAVPLRLDIIVGLHRLEDQMEVSLNPKDSNTETMLQFVKAQRSPDSRFLPENDFIPFKPLILHNLLEQLMLWRKSIVFGGFHRDPRSNNLKFHDGDAAVLLNDPPNTHSIRRHFAHTNTFTPILSALTVEELGKLEAGRERESRRRRRTGPTVASTNSKKSNSAPLTNFVNNLTGTVRSPPRTLPTPTSYRGAIHRIQSSANNTNSDDEESSVSGVPPKKRGRRAKH